MSPAAATAIATRGSGRPADGVEGVLDEVHHHLMELPLVADGDDVGLGGDVDRGAVALGLGGPGRGGPGDLLEVDRLVVAGAGEGEPAEVADDVGDADRAFQRPVDQRAEVFHERVDAVGAAQFGGVAAGVDAGEIVRQAATVAVERVDVAVDEADGVVEFVGDAGDEPAEARHLLLFHQPALGLLKFGVGAVQRLVGAAEFADRATVRTAPARRPA